MVVMALCLLSLSFDFKIILKAFFNNQGNDEYGMRKGLLSGSGYLMLEIRFCLMGHGDGGIDLMVNMDIATQSMM
jgi:hypothetical protein